MSLNEIIIGMRHPPRRWHYQEPLPVGMIEALERFREAYGRNWKMNLRREWMRGCTGVSDPNDRALLQLARHLFGPRELVRLRLAKPQKDA